MHAVVVHCTRHMLLQKRKLSVVKNVSALLPCKVRFATVSDGHATYGTATHHIAQDGLARRSRIQNQPPVCVYLADAVGKSERQPGQSQYCRVAVDDVVVVAAKEKVLQKVIFVVSRQTLRRVYETMTMVGAIDLQRHALEQLAIKLRPTPEDRRGLTIVVTGANR